MNRRGFLSDLLKLGVSVAVANELELIDMLTHKKVWTGYSFNNLGLDKCWIIEDKYLSGTALIEIISVHYDGTITFRPISR